MQVCRYVDSFLPSSLSLSHTHTHSRFSFFKPRYIVLAIKRSIVKRYDCRRRHWLLSKRRGSINRSPPLLPHSAPLRHVDTVVKRATGAVRLACVRFPIRRNAQRIIARGEFANFKQLYHIFSNQTLSLIYYCSRI